VVSRQIKNPELKRIYEGGSKTFKERSDPVGGFQDGGMVLLEKNAGPRGRGLTLPFKGAGGLNQEEGQV